MQKPEFDIQHLSEFILHNTADAVFYVDAMANVLYANEAATNLFNTPPQAFLGKCIYGFIDELAGEKWPEMWQKIKKNCYCTIIQQIMLPGGHRQAFRIRLNYYKAPEQEFAEFRIILKNLTQDSSIEAAEGKNLLANLEHSEYLYKAIARSIPNGILLCFDKNLRFTLAEGKAIEKLGYNPSHLLYKKVTDVVQEPFLAQLLPKFKAVLDGDVLTFEITLRSGDTFLITMYPLINDEEEILGAMLLAIDINKQKLTETELGAKIDELEQLNLRLKNEVGIRRKIEKNLKEYSEELKAKNQELEQFAYVASHDLQEPLRMISSFTQLLAQRYKNKLDADADEFINYVLDGAQRMQRLINDLLIYSRIGRKEQEFAQVPFTEVIETTKENLAIALAETDAKINFKELPTVFGDKQQLVQLVQNLFSNAMKFSRPNTTPVIEVTAEDKDKCWQFAIADNGIGIEMKHKDRIFNIFQRLHTQGSFPGTGIGLAICKKIVERHGGEIWVESTPGQGSTFYFTLRK